jgi:hypothetical protein
MILTVLLLRKVRRLILYGVQLPPRTINLTYTVEPGYNDIALYDTPPTASGIPRHQLIPHCEP